MLVSQLEHGDYFRHPTGALCRRSGARFYVCVDGAQCGGDLTGDTAVEPVTIMDATARQALVDDVLRKVAMCLDPEVSHNYDAGTMGYDALACAEVAVRDMIGHPL